jgi:hypothetical protein
VGGTFAGQTVRVYVDGQVFASAAGVDGRRRSPLTGRSYLRRPHTITARQAGRARPCHRIRRH